ncbi:hypothetical protein CYMTET_29573 [Cymbomonas tetramitiformis]|uniref:Nucleoprotein TPR/MLP1 domain-containing protein n=1 Tax=Cymbomonas tetramitiformis TaxID=36881 RepID=A0AAE0FKY9_9CHLO|nr:hypothetical protein CYMTET_29573 [Cymbomonas tetramitiformis]
MERLGASSDSETVKTLQNDIKKIQAQYEAAVLNAEHSSQAVEQRYNVLAEELSQVKRAKAELCKVHEEDGAKYATLQTETYSLKAKLVDLESEKQRQEVRIREADIEKRNLLEKCQQKDAEISEKNVTTQSYLDKIVTLSEDRSQIEGSLNAARREQRAAQAAQMRVEQEKQSIKQHSDWLAEELATKSQALLGERKRASSEVEALNQQLADALSKAESLSHKLIDLQEKFDSSEQALERAHEEILDLKKQSSDTNERAEQQRSTADRLSTLYKEKSEERANKVVELEGVITAMQEQLEEQKNAFDEALSAANEAREAAEAEASERRTQLERTVKAAAAGASPVSQIGSPAFESPIPMSVSKEGLTLTSMYSRYAETADALRLERAENRRLQAYLSDILQELEQKAPRIQEQREEQERMREELSQMEQRVQESKIDSQQLESQLDKAEAERARSERERERHETLTADLSRQVAVLLNELEEMRSAGQGARGVPASMARDSSALTAGQVISEQLVEFRNIQELQENNQKLLAVVRQLSDESEREQADLKEQFEKELQAHTVKASKELEELRVKREQQQELVEQIVRQRDMYKTMLHTATTGVPDAVANGAAAATSGNAVMPGPDTAALHKEAQAELERYKEETAKTLDYLRSEMEKYRAEAATCRTDAAKAKADAEFHQQRYTRLMDSSTSQQKELENLMKRNAEAALSITEHQRTLRQAEYAREAAEDELRVAQREKAGLEAEKSLLVAAEERMAKELREVAEDRARLAGSVEASKQVSEARESEAEARRETLAAETERLQKEWASVSKDLDSERTRNRDMTSAAEKKLSEERQRVIDASKSLECAVEARASAEKSAEVLEARVAGLQSQLAKAEEQVALALRGGPEALQGVDEARGEEQGTGAVSKERERELLAAAVSAKEDAAVAQQAAAAAAGHMEHFKMIAEKNEECLKDMQEAHDKFKQLANEAAEKATAEIAALLQSKTEAEAKLGAMSGDYLTETEALRKAKLEAVTESEQTKVALSSKQQELEILQKQIDALQADVGNYQKQWRTAQGSYEQEVVQHAEDIRRMNAAEAEVEQARGSVRGAQTAADDARAELSAAELRWEAEKARITGGREDAEKQLAALQQQNQLLHGQLESMAKEATERDAAVAEDVAGQPGAEGSQSAEGGGVGPAKATSNLTELMGYLRREKEMLECKLLLAEQERVRMQEASEQSKRLAADAESRLAIEQERAKSSVKESSDHAELMSKIEHLNVLRESNTQLRAENQRYAMNIRELKLEVKALEEQAEPMRKDLAMLRAGDKAHAEEVAKLKEDTAHWEKRATEMMAKYGQVDLKEYERVKEAASLVEKEKEELSSQLKVVTERDTKNEQQLAIARKQINLFNPNKLHPKEWQRLQEEKNKRLADLEEQVQGSENTAKEAATAATAQVALEAEKVKLQAELEKAQKSAEALQAEKVKLQAEKAEAVKAAAQAPPAEAAKADGAEKADGNDALKATIESLSAAKEENQKVLGENLKQKQQIQMLLSKLRSAGPLIKQKDATIAELRSELDTLKPPMEEGETPTPSVDAVEGDAAAEAMGIDAAPAPEAAPALSAEPKEEVKEAVPATVEEPAPAVPAASDTTMSQMDALRARALAKMAKPDSPAPAAPAAAEPPTAGKRGPRDGGGGAGGATPPAKRTRAAAPTFGIAPSADKTPTSGTAEASPTTPASLSTIPPAATPPVAAVTPLSADAAVFTPVIASSQPPAAAVIPPAAAEVTVAEANPVEAEPVAAEAMEAVEAGGAESAAAEVSDEGAAAAPKEVPAGESRAEAEEMQAEEAEEAVAEMTPAEVESEMEAPEGQDVEPEEVQDLEDGEMPSEEAAEPGPRDEAPPAATPVQPQRLPPNHLRPPWHPPKVCMLQLPGRGFWGKAGDSCIWAQLELMEMLGRSVDVGLGGQEAASLEPVAPASPVKEAQKPPGRIITLASSRPGTLPAVAAAQQAAANALAPTDAPATEPQAAAEAQVADAREPVAAARGEAAAGAAKTSTLTRVRSGQGQKQSPQLGVRGGGVARAGSGRGAGRKAAQQMLQQAVAQVAGSPAGGARAAGRGGQPSPRAGRTGKGEGKGGGRGAKTSPGGKAGRGQAQKRKSAEKGAGKSGPSNDGDDGGSAPVSNKFAALEDQAE